MFRMRAFVFCLSLVLLAPGFVRETFSATLVEALKGCGVDRGIVVHLGCGDGRLLTEIPQRQNFVVQGLDRDATKISTARTRLREADLHGPVSARVLRGAELPYIDNLVNLLVVEDEQGINRDEMLRVLRPLGVALIRNGEDWQEVTKPWPDEIDEWTHYLHNARGNAVSDDIRVGPPRRMQWSAGSLWGRSHEFNSSMPALVTAKGRVFYIFDAGITGLEDERLPEKWMLIARDAFNGTLLWERHLETWGSDKWKTKALRFLKGAIARRLVVDGNTLYCTVDYGGDVAVIDAATGTTTSTIPGTDGSEEILVSGDHVFVGSRKQLKRNKFEATITRYNKTTGRVDWQAKDEWLLELTLAIGEDAVVYNNRKELVCINREDGTPRWSIEGNKRGKWGKSVVIAGDTVVASSSLQVIALSLSDGSVKWETAGVKGRSMRDMDMFYADGQLWASGQDGTIAGYDLETGKPLRSLDASSVQSQGHHLRCYPARATNSFLITQFRGVEFLDLKDETEHNQNDWLRGSCTYGVMPANGFLYAPPHSCFCYSAAMSKGFTAFGSGSVDELTALADDAGPGAIEKGAHYGYTGQTLSEEKSWPTYRHDAKRSGSTYNALPDSIDRVWKVSLATELTPPVAAAGRTFVSAKDKHTIHAFDSASGQELWTFTTSGRIDSPPSIHKGTVLFGSADGYLYSVRADNGELCWRRRMAPQDRMMAKDGQLESVWRLHGSVAIDGGLAYVCAGRSSFLDGGLFLTALDPETGEIKHQTRLHTLSRTRVDREKNNFVESYHIEGAHSDILVAQGGFVYLNQMRFTRDLKLKPGKYLSQKEITQREAMNLDGKEYVNDEIFNTAWRGKKVGNYDGLANLLVDENNNLGEQELGLHLYTTSGFLDSSFFNRTYWMYSSVWSGFNITNLAPKSGQLIVFGDQLTIALKAYTERYALSPSMTPQTKGYLVVADDNYNEPTTDPRAWGKDKGMGWSRAEDPKWHSWLPVRVRAMVLSNNESLIVCGPPDIVKEGDPMAAFEGRMGSELWILNADGGKTRVKHKLSESPIFDGMIVADDRLLVATEQGDLICMAAAKDK